MPGRNLATSEKVMVAIALLLLVGGGIYVAMGGTDREAAVCTADARICPDGSSVGRVPPECNFAPCPGGSTTNNNGSGSGILPYNSGIRGTVALESGEALQTLVAVFRESDPVHAVAILESDRAGSFEVSLPPGEYVVGAGESNMPACPQTPATVEPDEYAEITISCTEEAR